MLWIVELFRNESVARAALILAMVVALGLALGSVRIFSIGLGIAGVLFSGLAAGHILHRCGIEINHEVLEFAREFGLILFVYTIGMQVGPGFLASLRRNGLPLNIMAGAIVILGAGITVAVWSMDRQRVPITAAVGLFSGSTTNTPSLAAAQQALKDKQISGEEAAIPGMAYAVAYPFGIIGIIVTMLSVRGLFRISPAKEAEALTAMMERDRPSKLASMNLEVRNANLDGLAIVQIPMLAESGVVISRVARNGKAEVAKRDTKIQVGDNLLAVGAREQLERIKLVIGVESKVDVTQISTNITTRRILVTKSHVLGRSVADLQINSRFGVMVTRITRAEVELPPGRTDLQFGDSLVVVGEESAIRAAAAELGDSLKQLNHPQVISMFIGIGLGVLVGSWPLHVGLPAPVRLGLAGGPLLVAIVLSRIGNIGPLVWYMPSSANFMVRELGICLFLACVGIKSGGGFWETLTRGHGFYWMALAAIITLVPLMLVALVGRAVYKVNYLTLCGLLAGSMTDPPALAFATHMTGSDAPSVSYATVYPLVMILRVLAAQIMVLCLA